jgi:heme ABC exporter ATP-binding subunit CcmA
MNSGASIIDASGLGKRFGRLYALRSITLSVQAGEFVTVFGRNGAGKTTFLRIVSSLVHSYIGEVRLFGEDLKKAGEETRARIGFLSHEGFLYRELTVADNLFFFARLYGVHPIGDRVDRLITRVGLEEKRNVVTRSLSRGMKQRLSLARAFIHEPELLLLDEPYTGLDEHACEILDKVLDEFIAGGGTVVLTTHNIERGMKRSHRLVVFDRGAVVYEASTSSINSEEFRRKYREMISS